MPHIVDILRKVSPRAYPNYLQAFDQGEAELEAYGLTSPLRLSHFLAQVLHETAGGTILFENLRYTTETRLLEIFGAGQHSAGLRPDEVPALLNNPEVLAERVYGLGNPKKAVELGNIRSGDGYRYRGGGAARITAETCRMNTASGV
jgi:putative chitinase